MGHASSSYYITDKEIEEKSWQLFCKMDQNRNRTLDSKEFMQFIKALKLVDKYDIDLDDCEMDFNRFQRCLRRFMKSVYSEMDKNEDGCLTILDLEKAKYSCKDQDTIENLEKILAIADINKNQEVSFQEFYVVFIDILKNKL